MVQPRFWKPNVLVCLLPVLLLALTGVSAQAQPTAGKTSDPKAYDAHLRRIGNWDGGDLGHTFLISACKQEKPCK